MQRCNNLAFADNILKLIIISNKVRDIWLICSLHPYCSIMENSVDEQNSTEIIVFTTNRFDGT